MLPLFWSLAFVTFSANAEKMLSHVTLQRDAGFSTFSDGETGRALNASNKVSARRVDILLFISNEAGF
jgi:hypothetical protein